MGIIITGSKGIIGNILTSNLKEYGLVLLDLPRHDVRDYSALLEIVNKNDVIIHLAWNTKKENIHSLKQDRENTIMFSNIYRVALRKKASRVIMASSVHVDDYHSAKPQKKLTIKDKPKPANPYGIHKLLMESLGREYARKGLEVICLRLGNVNRRDLPLKEDKNVWLSHRDLINLMKKCIDSKKVPNHFVVFYAISGSKNRVHDCSNPFRWHPLDNADRFRSI